MWGDDGNVKEEGDDDEVEEEEGVEEVTREKERNAKSETLFYRAVDLIHQKKCGFIPVETKVVLDRLWFLPMLGFFRIYTALCDVS